MPAAPAVERKMFKAKPSSRAIDTLIGAGTRIEGHVHFVGGMHVDGAINGNVACGQPDGFLSLSETGRVEGSIDAAAVKVNGVVNGDISALGQVELGPKAKVLGNVRYGSIESAVGAQINGVLLHCAAAVDPGSPTPGKEPSAS